VIEAANNEAAGRIGALVANSGRLHTDTFPAVDLDLFVRLLGQTTETSGPYPWQISLWAQVVRRGLRWYAISRHTRKWLKPLTIEGRENLEGLKGPAIFIANHSSHLDANAVVAALPERYRWRLAFGSAADRWFLKGRKGIQKQGWWYSLAMNNFPIKRGGGKDTLNYAKWLIDKGWSPMIFPEGTRSTTGKMGHFKHGVAILALDKKLPVVPLYMEGLREIRPKGSKAMKAGPVTVRIGAPVRFAEGTAVSDATRELYRAMEAMRQDLHARAPRRVPAFEPEAQPAGG
jgi:1-acyl-sn-glycerol-3-phosphate acyltransferase